MSKKWRSILWVNLLGCALFILSFFGTWKIKEQVHSAPLTVNTTKVKELLRAYPEEDLKEMLRAGEEILEWQRILAKMGSHITSIK
ncbi:MAG: hypothetical protein KDK60_02075 [Chlamydiia bacterium]|nr:hypothetical protein [Chlamydiia bacterium]